MTHTHNNVQQRKKLVYWNYYSRDDDRLLEVDWAVVTCQNTAEIHEAVINTNNNVYKLTHDKPQIPINIAKIKKKRLVANKNDISLQSKSLLLQEITSKLINLPKNNVY